MELFIKNRSNKLTRRASLIERKKIAAGKTYIAEQVQVIFGEQGSGKSRLIKKIWGVTPPTVEHRADEPNPAFIYSWLENTMSIAENTKGSTALILAGYDCSDAKFNTMLRYMAAAGIKIFITLQNGHPDFEKIPGNWEVIETGYPVFDHQHYHNGRTITKHLNASQSSATNV